MLDEIYRLIEQYIAGEIDVAEFSQRFAGLYAGTRQNRNVSRAAAQLCGAVIGPFAEYSRGHRSEASLKGELANAVRPFAERLLEQRQVLAIANNSTLPYSVNCSPDAAGQARSASAPKITRKPLALASSANSAGLPQGFHEALM